MRFFGEVGASNPSEPQWDIHFRVLAEDSQRAGRTFAGLVFAHQGKVSFARWSATWNSLPRRLTRHSGLVGSKSFLFDERSLLWGERSNRLQ
mgnify:CR=1 FL=1